MAAADYSGKSFRYDKGVLDKSLPRPMKDTYPLRPRGDAVLGEHDLYVGLSKTSEVTVWWNGEEHALTAFLDEEQAKQYRERTRHIMHVDMPGDHRLSLLWFDREHFVSGSIHRQVYIFARLRMDYDITWTGYSGYHVGKDFAEPGEEPEYMQSESEFSSDAVEGSLQRIFPVHP